MIGRELIPPREAPGLGYAETVGGTRYVFADLKTLLARATPPRSGDRLAGLEAAVMTERVAAQLALADLPLRRLIEDPVLQLVFELYGLWHEDDTATVTRALDSVRPYIESHGGEVEVLSVDDGVVRLRLAGSCHGCSGSTNTLKRGIETALRENYDSFKEMIVEQSIANMKTGTISLLDQTFDKPAFVEALPLADLPDGALRGVILGDARVLLVRSGMEIYAYKNACLDSPLPLDLGILEGTVLRCSWHGCSFDATTGVALAPTQGELLSYPVAVEDVVVRVATNVPGRAISALSA